MLEYYGWVRKKEVMDILLALREIYHPIDSETIQKSFYIGGQDALETALEKLIGEEKATKIIFAIEEKRKKEQKYAQKKIKEKAKRIS